MSLVLALAVLALLTSLVHTLFPPRSPRQFSIYHDCCDISVFARRIQLVSADSNGHQQQATYKINDDLVSSLVASTRQNQQSWRHSTASCPAALRPCCSSVYLSTLIGGFKRSVTVIAAPYVNSNTCIRHTRQLRCLTACTVHCRHTRPRRTTPPYLLYINLGHGTRNAKNDLRQEQVIVHESSGKLMKNMSWTQKLNLNGSLRSYSSISSASGVCRVEHCINFSQSINQSINQSENI